MHNRRLNLEPRHQHTCEWILGTNEYRQWVTASHNLLWIKGKPGAGKSTVMAFLYDELQKATTKHTQQWPDIQLAFFFNARGTELQHTFQGMLRSLLHQLSLLDLPTRQRIQALFDEKNRLFGDTANTWQWQISELKALFMETVVATGRHRPVNVFVDALDEAGEQSARQMAQYFHQIIEQVASAPALVKICISCRHYPIVSSYRASLEVIVEEHNKNDINAYIHDTLPLNQYTNDGTSEQATWGMLESMLNDRAQANFQWARLVVPMVQRRIDKGESPEGILRKLSDVPEELRDVYNHIIQNVIDEEDRQLSFCLFQWVCLAGRPLTITEMRYALAFTDVRSTYKHTPFIQAHDIIGTDERMRLRLKSLSGGLVETSVSDKRGREYVQVGHQSVTDFMLTEGLAISAALSIEVSVFSRLPTAFLGIRDVVSQCQARLYWACLEYLSTDAVLSKKIPDGFLSDSERDTIKQELPLASYAIDHLLYHAIKAGSPRTNTLAQEVMSLLRVIPQWRVLKYPCSITYIFTGFSGFELLHFAAMANMIDVLKYLLEEKYDVQVRNRDGATALLVAVKSGHQTAAAVLLKHGASINDCDRRGRTALVLAMNNHDILMIKWLLSHGAQPSARPGKCLSAFHFAVDNGSAELVRLFLAAGADLNTPEGESGSALQVASVEGHAAVVEILLDAGANVNGQGGRYGNALQAASVKGCEEIVKTLLDAGANVNQQGGKYGNALQGASMGGHEAVVKLLLESGAEVNQYGGCYGTAMRAAVFRGQVEVAKILQDAGSDGYEEPDNSIWRWKFAGSSMRIPFDLANEMLFDANETIRSYARRSLSNSKEHDDSFSRWCFEELIIT